MARRPSAVPLAALPIVHQRIILALLAAKKAAELRRREAA